MFHARSRMYAAVVGALSMGAAAYAAEPSQQDLKIQELEAKVAALETKQAANSKDLAATIDSVLRDAEKRSQLLATSGDVSAGYDAGFFIRSGEWLLRPGALFQFRHVSNYRLETADRGEDQINSGFEIARMKFSLEGTAFTRDLEYAFIWNTFNDSGTLFLEEAWAKYMFADDYGVRVGQFRDPVGHEWLVNDGRQLAVDRSMMDTALIGGPNFFTQGATLIYGGYNKNNPFNAEVGYTDGAGQANTDIRGREISGTNELPSPEPFVSFPPGIPGPHVFDWGIAGRVEWKAMGNWASYRDFTAKDTKEDLLVLGAGGDWSQGGDGDMWTATIDAQYENSGGLGVYVAGVARRLDDEIKQDGNAKQISATTDWGFLAQAGYMINPQWEIFGRYDATWMDQHIQGEEDFHEITLGVNYYLGQNGSAMHRAKVTVDLTYLPNGAPAGFTNIGIRDENNGHGEWMLRGQFQLWI